MTYINQTVRYVLNNIRSPRLDTCKFKYTIWNSNEAEISWFVHDQTI